MLSVWDHPFEVARALLSEKYKVVTHITAGNQKGQKLKRCFESKIAPSKFLERTKKFYTLLTDGEVSDSSEEHLAGSKGEILGTASLWSQTHIGIQITVMPSVT